MAKLAVFASGTGSNFVAIAAALKAARRHSIEFLLCDVAGAAVLQRSRELEIPSVLMAYGPGQPREAVEKKMVRHLERRGVDLVALAGFMKLVGASNVYVRGPLVVTGIIYGLVSAAITLVIMAAAAYWSDALLLRLAGVDMAANFQLLVNVFSDYFRANFNQIFTMIVSSGVILGGLSSYVAAKRYLKV